jgi:uncharacterized membrane protein YgcG
MPRYRSITRSRQLHIARVARSFAIFAAIGFIMLLGTSTSHADSPTPSKDQTLSFEVVLKVKKDGTLEVTARITQEFVEQNRHGIELVVPLSESTSDGRTRSYEVTNVSAKATNPDTSSNVEKTTRNSVLYIRVGDPLKTVSGLQTYVIRYTVNGATTQLADHDEFRWRAIGPDWRQRIITSTTTIELPGSIKRSTCTVGFFRQADPCDTKRSGDLRVTFSQKNIRPEQTLTVTAEVARGSLHAHPTFIRKPGALERVATKSIPGIGVFALLVGPAFAFVVKTRRQRTFPSSLRELQVLTRGNPLISTTTLSESKNAEPPSVENVVDDLAPAERAAIATFGQTRPAMFSATLLDLAIRGHLVISDSPQWNVTWNQPAATEQSHPDLLRPFEAATLNALFSQGTNVNLHNKQVIGTAFSAMSDGVKRNLDTQGWVNDWSKKVARLLLVFALMSALTGPFLILLANHDNVSSLRVFGIGLIASAVPMVLLGFVIPARTIRGAQEHANTVARMRSISGLRPNTADGDPIGVGPLAVALDKISLWSSQLQREGQTISTLAWFETKRVFKPSQLGGRIRLFHTTIVSTLMPTNEPTVRDRSHRPTFSTGSGGGGSGGGSGGGGGGSGGGGSW